MLGVFTPCQTDLCLGDVAADAGETVCCGSDHQSTALL